MRTKKERAFSSPYLSDYAGRKIAVVCQTCELSRRYDADALLAKINDHCMPELLRKIATAEGCYRVGNDWYDRCTLHYDTTRMTMGAIRTKDRGNGI